MNDSIFREYEIEVLHLMLDPVFGAEAVETLVSEAKEVTYEHTGCGYFLTATHPSLASDRAVYTKPYVSFKLADCDGGFIIFVEKKELTLECYTMGLEPVSHDYRNIGITVSID